MKAIIPVAGAGTQLRPLTYTQPKPLIPVAGKPIIAYILDSLIEAGIQKYVFVLGYLGEKIKLYLEEEYPNIHKEYVYQEPRKGTAHALYECSDHLNENEDLVIHFGDTILDLDLKTIFTSGVNTIGVKRTDQPTDFGIVEIDDLFKINKITEKPKIPKSNWAMVGIYYITDVKHLIKALHYVVDQDLLTHGELQLTDALMHMIESDVAIKAFEVNSWWDCGRKDKLLNTNAYLLDKQYPPIQAQYEEGNIIIPPVSIGRNCQISNAILGPHVSIGDNTTIEKSILWNTIVGNYSELREAVMKDSVLGNDVAIRGFSQALNIGDNADIDMSH